MTNLLTPDQLARILGVSRRTVAEVYARDPAFPKPIRLPSSRLLRWHPEDIDKWIQAQR